MPIFSAHSAKHSVCPLNDNRTLLRRFLFCSLMVAHRQFPGSSQTLMPRAPYKAKLLSDGDSHLGKIATQLRHAPVYVNPCRRAML
jgi:hypothetical protein